MDSLGLASNDCVDNYMLLCIIVQCRFGYFIFAVLQSRPCLASPRPCSHVCLRDSFNGYECGCPPTSNSIDGGTNCSGEYWMSLQLHNYDEKILPEKK